MDEPYRFRMCSHAMQVFKNKYWTTLDITVVLPPGFMGTKKEIAHCVLVLGCLINTKERLPAGVLGHVGDRIDILKDVYGDDKDKELAAEADRAYHHYQFDAPFLLSWIEWLLLANFYKDVLHKKEADIRPLARLAALADI